jgi:hypothetical protein
MIGANSRNGCGEQAAGENARGLAVFSGLVTSSPTQADGAGRRIFPYQFYYARAHTLPSIREVRRGVPWAVASYRMSVWHVLQNRLRMSGFPQTFEHSQA